MRELQRIRAILAAGWLAMASADAGWHTAALPPVANPYGATALAHLPDGRLLYAQSGLFYGQAPGISLAVLAFSNAPPAYSTDPSFIAVHDAQLAVAGKGTWGNSDFVRFDPADLATAFSNVGPVVQNFCGQFYDAGRLLVAGANGAAYAGFYGTAYSNNVMLLALDGSTQHVVIRDFSPYSGGLARATNGDWYVGSAPDNHLRRFTAAQVAAACAGAPLHFSDGEPLCTLGSVGSLAVDDAGHVWAAGYGIDGLQVYDPATGGVYGHVPALANPYYQVSAFVRGGTNWIGFINRHSWLAGGNDPVTYGFAEVARLVPPAPPYAAADHGIHYSSNILRGWVTGLADVQQPDETSGGYAWGDVEWADGSLSNAILGRPAAFDGAAARHVYSLGNGGSLVLTFAAAMRDGPGPDFAVFENGFVEAADWTGTSREGATNDFTFAELAFVEVATTPDAWARFPSVYLNRDELFGPVPDNGENRFSSQDATRIDGLAGKHTLDYGTPFDLAALADLPAVTNGSVDLREINYIRLVDVVGDGSTTDSWGHAIFDPYYDSTHGYPEPAPSAGMDGFDLRGVAVIHFAAPTPAPHATAEGLQLAIPAMSNFVYQVQYADHAAGPWHDLGPAINGQGQVATATDAWALGGYRFYRVQQAPAEGAAP